MAALHGFFKLYKQALDDYKITLRKGINQYFQTKDGDLSLEICLVSSKQIISAYLDKLSEQSKLVQSDLVDNLDLYLKDYKISSDSMISKA